MRDKTIQEDRPGHFVYPNTTMGDNSQDHPYYPLGAGISGYSPNELSTVELLIKAGGGCAVLLGLTFTLVSYTRPKLRVNDRIAVLWFVLCT